MAVFRYRLPNGEERTLAIDSEPFSPGGGKRLGEGHSEERLDMILEAWGIDPDWVVEIYSELEPCAQRGHFCANLIKQVPEPRGPPLVARLPVRRDVGRDQGADEGDPREERQRLPDNVRDLPGEQPARRAWRDTRQEPIRPGPRPAAGADPHFTPRFPGGIDLTSLQLRSVADAGRGGLRYAFRGLPSAAPTDLAAGEQTVGGASDALFAWLALPPQTFWVNLNPSEPNRIIDPGLARTDAGRVLLEADLKLKKDTVNLINPDTALGDRFWDAVERLYGERAPQACVSFRVWIVPEPATVREDRDALYILDAPLTVKNQSMVITDPAVGKPGCPQEIPAIEAQKEQLMRTLIMPEVLKAVNTAPAYADLRRVYLSRVAAEWFRQRSARKQTPVSGIVNSGNVDRWATETPWDPKEVFGRYLQSLRKGEWTAHRKVQVGDRVYERTMIYGGSTSARRRAPRSRSVTSSHAGRDSPSASTAPSTSPRKATASCGSVAAIRRTRSAASASTCARRSGECRPETASRTACACATPRVLRSAGRGSVTGCRRTSRSSGRVGVRGFRQAGTASRSRGSAVTARRRSGSPRAS